MAVKNPSVAAFRQLLERLPPEATKELVRELDEQSARLADSIRATVPVRTGKLRDSVRVTKGRSLLRRVVQAGGQATTKEVRSGSGVGYDYSLGIEFGNERTGAQPFFYPTWRAKRESIRRRLRDRAIEAIKKVVTLK